ncbi:hypothetical protein [Bacteroides sp. 224]|uniref:hypothetical protein n=1 Tax=Bacteroides sp. 224 TaxID=2302936 RepID=UPI0013D16137|nr:hypothetical protein [Bacteroides sp. 224]NDV66616.1 hypothetical protein [Bacteroides sp. 224]
MKKINKGTEPKAWKQFRETPGVTEYVANDALRESLLEEQGYICAYCMRRIPVRDKISNETSRIDHLKCRDNYPDLQLDYNNMVICCPGCINGDDHCDKLKGNKEITFSPFEIHLENSISYSTKDGHIKSSNVQWNKELEEVLNLNNHMLKLNRRQAIEGLRSVLEKSKWSKSVLQMQLQKWESFDKNHHLKPYCGVIIWYLRKKLHKVL